VADTELAQELLQIEEADAWFEYLEATRAQNETRDAELEPCHRMQRARIGRRQVYRHHLISRGLFLA